MVLLLVQQRYVVCVKPTIARISFWTLPIELLGDVGHVESRLVYFEMVFVLVQERCMVCTKRTIG